jgi:hypothetical protein
LLGIHAALHQRCWHLKFTWANAGHCTRTQDSLHVVRWYIGLWYTDLTQPELRALCELGPTVFSAGSFFEGTPNVDLQSILHDHSIGVDKCLHMM